MLAILNKPRFFLGHIHASIGALCSFLRVLGHLVSFIDHYQVQNMNDCYWTIHWVCLCTYNTCSEEMASYKVRPNWQASGINHNDIQRVHFSISWRKHRTIIVIISYTIIFNLFHGFTRIIHRWDILVLGKK